VAKDSFILYTEQKEVIDKLSDEQAGKLIKAIYEYVETGQMPKLDALLEIIVIPFKQNIDRNANKYEETKKKRSEAGKIGAEVKKQMKAKQANANFAKSKQANQADNVNDNENVNENDNDNNNNDFVSDSCVDGLQEVIDFYSNNIGFLNPYGLKILESYVEDMSSELVIYAMQIAVENNKKTISYIKAILNNWSKANIKTLEVAKKENKKKISNDKQIEQRKYTEDEFKSLYANKE
jgi:DnaD/phage-associated family protein